MVDLVALLQPAQDRDRVLDRRLADQHRLEAALERRVLLDVLAVLVERRRADRAQLAAREHRLEHVAGVHRALGGAGADDRVQLVDEHDDLALGVGDLLEHRLQPVLELAAVLRAGDHRAEVERDHAPVLQALGHVAVHDPLREALDDRGLADAGLADQHRVVLRPAAREHLDHAADLVVAADHRVELALLGRLGQVAAVLLERLELVLGVLVGDAVRPRPPRAPSAAPRATRRRRAARRRPAPWYSDSASSRCSVETYSSFSARISFSAARRTWISSLEPPAGSGAAAAQLRQRVERAVDGRADDGRGSTPSLRSTGTTTPSGLLEQHREQVLGRGLRVAALVGEPLRGLNRLLGLDRESVWLHRTLAFKI